MLEFLIITQFNQNLLGKKGSEKKFLKLVTIVSTFGGLLFGYDTGVINGALPFMARPDQLNLNPFTEGLVASSLVLGAAFWFHIWRALIG
ncbi:hypothetical protein GCM10020331_085000 [Ectobacillus funiculus]